MKTKLLFLAALILNLVPNMEAADFQVNGLSYWFVYENNNVVGVEVAWPGYTNPQYSYHNDYEFTELTIPESVTYNGTNYQVKSIGNQAFMYCSSLTKIVLPNTITKIGEQSFSDCNNLTDINMPPSLIEIGPYAFQETSIKDIQIPNTVSNIGNSAFIGCTSLENVILPNGLSTINYNMFHRCSSLKKIRIPATVSNINRTAFGLCTSLEEVVCESMTPPTASNDAFSGVPFSTCKLVVPKGSKNTYAASSVWSEFTNISELQYSFIINGLAYAIHGNSLNTVGLVKQKVSIDYEEPCIVIPSSVIYDNKGM